VETLIVSCGGTPFREICPVLLWYYPDASVS
jgi:hypothetical protein